MASKCPGMLTRRSMSRPDSSGGRKEIPLQGSLDQLKPETSSEQPAAGDRRSNAGGIPRSKTPVGSAAPRRSISANRSSNVQVQHYQQQPGNLADDDDSLVLYKDPSDISGQASMTSVVSGRHQEGETFFTALRRNYSFESEQDAELDSFTDCQAAGGRSSLMSSQLNPMQSPTSSAYFSAAGDSEYLSAAGGLQSEYSAAASMVTCESSYTVYQEASGAAAGSQGVEPTASVMDIINSLYCSTTSAAGGNQHHKWQELDQDGRPLIQQPASTRPLSAASATSTGQGDTATAAAAGGNYSSACQQPHAELSGNSSVGSSDPTAAGGYDQLGMVAAGQEAATGEELPVDDAEALQQGTYLTQQASDDCLSLSSAASTSNAGTAAATLVPAAAPELEGSGVTAEDSTSAAAAAAAQHPVATAQPADSNDKGKEGEQRGGLSDELSAQQQQQQQQQQPALVQSAEDNEPALTAEQELEQQASSIAYLQQVERGLSSRAQLQVELSSYIHGLSSKEDEAGQQLVELPPDYALQVERMLREHRSQYKALEGWEGPHRFDELPVAQLPVSHDDPRIAAGLENIRQLDEQLKEAWLTALVTSRGADPEQWAETERRRLAKRAADLDEGLARERARRLHAARLLRALKKLDDDEPDGLQSMAKGLSSYSYYKLQPQEEQLLAAVISRDEAALELDNPFDASTMCLDYSGEHAQLIAAHQSQQLMQQSSLSSDGSNVLGSAAAAGSAGQAASASEPAVASESAAGAIAAADAAADHASSPIDGAGHDVAMQGLAAGILHDTGSMSSYLRPSTAGTLRSGVSSSSSSKRRTLAEINALLEALHSQFAEGLHHQQMLRPSMCSSKPCSAQPSSIGQLSSSTSAAHAKLVPRHSSDSASQPAAVAQEAAAVDGGSSSGTYPLSAKGCTNQQQYEVIGRSQQRDFVREQREAKELLQREREVDAKLRALRVSELPAKLPAEQLQRLLQECVKAQGREEIGRLGKERF